VDSVDRPEGRSRVADYLETRPYPRYEPHPKKAGFLVRIDEDGKRTAGRFVDREFRTGA
jgi:hypothetical protein